MKADPVRAVSLREVAGTQPSDEVVDLFVAPHPGRETCEGREGQLGAGRITEDVVVDAGGVRPVCLDGDEVEATTRDELFRDPGAHPIELAGPVRGLAEENEPRASDAFEQSIQGRGVDVVDRFGGLANELGDRTDPESTVQARAGSAPSPANPARR